MFYASAHDLRSETLSLHGRSLTYEISVTHPGMLVGYAVSIIIAAAIFAAYLALKCRRRKPIVEKGVLPVLAPKQPPFEATTPRSGDPDASRTRREREPETRHYRPPERTDYNARWHKTQMDAAKGAELWNTGRSSLPEKGPRGVPFSFRGHMNPASEEAQEKAKRAAEARKQARARAKFNRDMAELDDYLGVGEEGY